MAIVIQNSSSQAATFTSGNQVTNCALKIGAAPERYLRFSVAMRSNTGSINAGSVFWQPAGNATGQEELTFLGAISHPTDALRVETWGLLNPSVSTASTSRVVFTPNVGVKGSYTATCYQHVDQTTPYAGYPSTPTNLVTGSGSTAASGTVGDTTALTVSTAADELVVDVFGSDLAATTNNYNAYQTLVTSARVSTGGSVTSNIRMGTSTIVATGSTQDVKWRSYAGTATSFNSGQSGRAYVHAAFSLKPSTSVAPYWVLPPNEIVAVGGTTAAALRFNSIADWPTAGAFGLYQTIGPTESSTATNLLSKQFTSHSPVLVTGASSYAGSVTMADTTIYKMVAGDGQSQLGTGTIILYVPSTAAADDVILINVYTEGATVSAATFASAGSPTATEIASQASGSMRQTLLWKRLTAADISASTITITFSATPGWRSAIANIYRGCITSRTPFVNSTDDAGSTALPTVNTGTSTTPTFTGVTTEAADHTVILAGGQFNNGTWTATPGQATEREEFFNLWMGELTMASAAATGDMTVTVSGSTAWATMVITLIPNSASSTTFPRTIATPSITGTRTAARKVNPYYRITPAIGISGTRTATRKANPYKRAASNSAISITVSVTRKLIRTRSRVISISGTRSVARKANPYKRSPQRLGSITITITHVPPAGATTFQRSVSMNRSGTRSVSRKVTPYIRAASRTTTITLTLVRRGNPVKRAAAMSRSGTRSVTRKANPYKRGLSRVGTVSLALTGGVASAITWFDYRVGTGEPLIMVIGNVGTTYPGCTFRLEAQLKATTNQKVYARLYSIDGAAAVANSQVETSNPHTTSQVVRSSPITIASGVRYKAQVGRTAGSLVEPTYVRVGVRSVP